MEFDFSLYVILLGRSNLECSFSSLSPLDLHYYSEYSVVLVQVQTNALAEIILATKINDNNKLKIIFFKIKI